MKLNTKKKKEPTLSQLDFVLPRITQTIWARSR